MASLATKLPKVFVIPRSSSFTALASVGAGREARPVDVETRDAAPALAGRDRAPVSGSGSCGGGLGLDDHGAVDDLLGQGLQLLGELCGDLVLEVVEGGQTHAAVLEGADVRAGVELAARSARDD